MEEKEKRKNNRKIFANIVVLIVFSLVSFFIGFNQGKEKSNVSDNEKISLEDVLISRKDAKEKDKTIDFSLFWNVWDLVKEKYVDADNLNAKDLFYDSIDGMLRATGDPYTTFFDPEENKNFNEDISGTFEGVGAEIGIKVGILTVIAPLEGSPAEKAGLRAGDKILKINDESTAELSLDKAVDKIRGPKGTEVKLSIYRNGDDDSQELSIIRDMIDVKSVKLEFKDKDVAYIKISRFGDDTKKEFFNAVSEANNKNIKGLIIDLRNDPGGYLDVSVEIANKLLPKNTTVVIEEDGKGNQKILKTQGGDVFSEIKTVVLINEGSASASEILAGALRENRENVTLVGEKSFGKGSVQELINLSHGTAVKITVAKWLTPNGNQINNVGIEPDVKIELTKDDYENDRDPQMDEAMKIVNQ